MRIALVQTNPIIGDFDSNLAAILARAQEARQAGCELAIFSELVLCGYPPQDLLQRPAFLARHDRALAALTEASRRLGIGLLCGCLSRSTAEAGKALLNSAILIENGEPRLTHKRLLPTYDVFDESRYFEPGPGSTPIVFRGLRLGVTICEDLFNDPSLCNRLFEGPSGEWHSPRHLYRADPLADLLRCPDGPPDLLVNLAASPFHLGKPEARQAYFSTLCARHRIPLLYVNQVGGQDSLIFDGHSLAVDASGNIAARARGFGEDLIVIDTAAWPPPSGHATRPEDEDVAQLFAALVLGTQDYVRKCGFSKVLLGLSGGVDSALTCAIAVEALGSANVLGVALPSPYTSPESIEDAGRLAANLGIRLETIPIHHVLAAQLDTLQPLFAGRAPDVTEQNIQARIRGNLLMALANKFGRLLLTTGNKSEMAVGYCTLYGDMSGGLAVIADVPKMKVYALCHHLNRNREVIPARTILRAPTAELAPNQKDEDDLPPYRDLDAILEAYLEEHLDAAAIVARGFPAAMVSDVVRRIMANEHKRKQAPLGLRVTSKAFGLGRRYPITHRFHETT